jgi:hypothetical protein
MIAISNEPHNIVGTQGYPVRILGIQDVEDSGVTNLVLSGGNGVWEDQQVCKLFA